MMIEATERHSAPATDGNVTQDTPKAVAFTVNDVEEAAHDACQVASILQDLGTSAMCTDREVLGWLGRKLEEHLTIVTEYIDGLTGAASSQVA